MRDPYLLAASLLTGLAIPASALPQMSIILPENSRFHWDLKQGSQLTIGEKTIPSVDISLPEFYSQALQTLESSPPRVGEKIIPNFGVALPEFTNQVLLTPVEPSLNPTSLSANRTLASNSQLYYQRLAALKTGQINKRLDEDSLQSVSESAKKRQLTYDDWKRLLALEAKAIAQSKGANRLGILVGDSLSMWFPKEKLPAGKLWLNQGISGDTSSGVLKRLAAFSETRPDVIYVMAGINDIRKGASDEVILRNHRRIMRSLRQAHPNAQIIIQSILPARLPTISNQRIRHLNTQLALIAKQEKVTYINIYRWFTDFEGNLRPELTTDGLHLSPDGYDVWRAALEQIELRVTQRNN
ncbi:SGNH/GDSL hydrolase family protein [Nostoc sp. 106C]|uniref:SGNH/GDSL hydrolase family protein n=1 Tax=Nostoc sp. 106C TaxID=1932667 RepID=UPI000A386E35|nr:SGNH/GDSL hydrolase family protein [Nostoc sp. 106C]OUL34311.1 G-D-S-L family lipolytic protein [Nostoc sp. 106C]